jgi:hypothetical protein
VLGFGNERVKKKKRNTRSHEGEERLSFQEVGPSHISDEVPVMGMERRAWVISVDRYSTN